MGQAFEDLKQAINENFWVEDGGYYASWQYPEYMGNVLAEKTDVIATGYAIYYDIATPEMAERLMENYPLVKYGANTVTRRSAASSSARFITTAAYGPAGKQP
mgnify:CR=1 FL=1